MIQKDAFRSLIWLLAVFFAANSSLFAIPQAHATAGWNTVISDSFIRSNSASIGNGWLDPAGVGSIVGNSLVLTAPAGGTGVNSVRILRPASEATLDQRIDVTDTLADTGGIGHGVILRGKSVIVNGIDISPAITVTFRHSGSLSFALAYSGYVDFVNPSGTTGFTPAIGHSYTLSVSISNNFPALLTATVTDNTASSQVANASLNISGEYGGADLSPYWKTPGALGLTMEGNAGQSVAISNVTTYSFTPSGALTAPSSDALAVSHDAKTYLATPLPTGGTPAYTVRWYRGGNGFTPPTASDGSGSGTGTFIGTGQEMADATAPAGVSNFSLSYRPVFFDTGANSSTGILGNIVNLNSPDIKPLASPMYVGDSITYGYQTSSGGPGTSPGEYANANLSADTAVSGAYQMHFFAPQSIASTSAPGRTSADFATTDLPILASYAADKGVSVVNIMLGTNDAKDSIATSSAAYKVNMQTIITTLKAANPSIRIVLEKPIWFKPDTGYGADFSTASLARLQGYFSILDQLADGTSIVVGDLAAYNEVQAYGWTGTTGTNNPSNATTSYPPAPTGGKSYLTDGLHPYDGGDMMIAATEWAPNIKNALLGTYTPAYDGAAPVFSSAATSSDGSTVTATFSDTHGLPLKPSTGITGLTVGGGHTVTSATVSGQDQVVLAVSPPIQQGESITLSIGSTNLSDQPGNLVAPVSGLAVANNSTYLVVSATPTPAPTSGPTPVSTPSASASPVASATPSPTPADIVLSQVGASAFSVSGMTSGQRPAFSGTAPAGSVVTVTVHSDPISCTATTDSTGHWSCTVGKDIPIGSHTVSISATTSQGNVLTLASFPLTVTGSLATTGSRTRTETLFAALLAFFGIVTFPFRRRLAA